MISKNALLIFLAQNNKQKKTGRPLASQASETPVKVQNIDLLNLQSKIDGLQAEKNLLKEIINQQKETIEQSKRLEDHLVTARKQVERELEYQRVANAQANEKIVVLENRIQQLMVYLSLPWWRRIGNPMPMITLKE
jgi:predicted RNase H-like nuclease (RuvC/YqgF family)